MQKASYINQPAEVSMSSSKRPTIKTIRAKRLSRIISVFAFIVIIPLAITSLLVTLFQANELILPKVFILNKEVGMMKRQDVVTWVDQFWNQDRKIQLSVSGHPDISYTVKPSQLGLWVDAGATANAAYSVGRTANPFRDVYEAINGEPQIALPVLFFDHDTAKATLNAIAKELYVSPTNARIIYKDDVWIALPGEVGQALDIQSIQNYLVENAFEILQSQTATLPLQDVTPDIEDLSPILGEIEETIATEYRLEAYDPITDESFEWTIPTEVKRSWVEYNPQTYAIHLTFTHDNVQALLTTWEQDLGGERKLMSRDQIDILIEKWRNHEPMQTMVQYQSTTYTVQPGESLWGISLKLGIPMWYILEANEGLTSDNITSAMVLNIPPKDILLPLPIVRDKRIVIDISEQKMTVYENGQVRNTHIISTGMDDSPTMAGIFQIQSHEINAYASNWDLYMPHFMGIYEAWPDFMNGIHGLPLLSNGQRLWASNLGSPASYGCIILNLAAAEDLFYWAEDGVVVEIIR